MKMIVVVAIRVVKMIVMREKNHQLKRKNINGKQMGMKI